MLAIYGNGSGGVSSTAPVPVNQIVLDALGNYTTLPEPYIADVNLDGYGDIIFNKQVGNDSIGNPTWHTYVATNPGNGTRSPATWPHVLLGDDSLWYGDLLDFNGDGELDICSPNRFLTPTTAGPVVSPQYNFDDEVSVRDSRIVKMADFDGDGDMDVLRRNLGNGIFLLVRNQIIDERSGVAARMRSLGTLGPLSNPEQDADGDGRSNACEFMTGNDPRVPDVANNSRLKAGISLSVSNATIFYWTRGDEDELNIDHVLERSNDLQSWNKVDDSLAITSIIEGAWNLKNLTLPRTGAREFYRVVTKHAVPE